MTELNLLKTDDVMNADQVREFYVMEPEEEIELRIETHNGIWIKEFLDENDYPFPSSYQWRFWEYEGIHE